MFPKRIKSIWTDTTPQVEYPRAANGLNTETLIIGGGIAGINAAYFLLGKGIVPVIIEKGKLMSGTSGNTTAKITSQHGLKFSYLKRFFGRRLAKIYGDSNEWAIGEVERIISKENIDCDFYRAPSYIFAETKNGLRKVKDEIEAAKDLGLPASFVSSLENLPFRFLGAEKFENQAYFHPGKFLSQVAKLVVEKGGKIYENSLAFGIEEDEDMFRVKIEDGFISAKNIIIATNFPFYDTGFFFAREHQIRSYAMALKLNSKFPDAVMIGEDRDRLSFRPCPIGKEEWLIIGGEDYIPGESSETEDHFANLEKLAQLKLNIKSIDYMWAAEDSYPIDRLPFIGEMPSIAKRSKEIFRNLMHPWLKNNKTEIKSVSGKIYVTTGFGEWGMTTSFVSAKILSDLIAGEENEWLELYDPTRVNIAASAKNGIKMGARVIRGLARHIPIELKSEFKMPGPGEAKVINYKGTKTAVYNEDGNIHSVSAICTHMGCIIDWNDMEKTWDCPCHGSRFTFKGEVINGPAAKSLKTIKIDKK